MVLQPATSNRKLKICVIFGVVLTLAPFYGLFGTVTGMIGAFHSLGESGIAHPEFLSHSIGFAMVTTIVGLVLCPFGIALLIYALVSYIRIQRSHATPTI